MTRKRPRLSLDEYERGVRGRDRAVLAQAITLVESRDDGDAALAQALLTRLLPATGAARRVGVTGVPGVGKSTFVDELGMRLLGRGKKVAVLAIDPSSTVTGGSILGDKTRMARLSLEPQAFIRPSPSGLSPGGIARRTRETMLLCEAAGFDVILVETVGVGQGETAVADMVDFFLVLVLAGAGDELRASEGCPRARGRHRRQQVRRRQRRSRSPGARRSAGGAALPAARPPELGGARARRLGPDREGLDALWEIVEEHHAAVEASGEARRDARRAAAILDVVADRRAPRSHLSKPPRGRGRLARVEADVLAGRMTPPAATDELFAAFGLAPADAGRRGEPCRG